MKFIVVLSLLVSNFASAYVRTVNPHAKGGIDESWLYFASKDLDLNGELSLMEQKYDFKRKAYYILQPRPIQKIGSPDRATADDLRAYVAQYSPSSMKEEIAQSLWSQLVELRSDHPPKKAGGVLILSPASVAVPLGFFGYLLHKSFSISGLEDELLELTHPFILFLVIDKGYLNAVDAKYNGKKFDVMLREEIAAFETGQPSPFEEYVKVKRQKNRLETERHNNYAHPDGP